HHQQFLKNLNTLINSPKLNQIPLIFIHHTHQHPSHQMPKPKYPSQLHKPFSRESNHILIQKITSHPFYKTTLQQILKKLPLQQFLFLPPQTQFSLHT
ncbi:isochorismatase family protein, partial [Bacillus mycoides]|uniref:isochorismatase family protein n=1 Tax=Bacillus mycoides TaxID=1405 RepID=UPI0011AADD3B